MQRQNVILDFDIKATQTAPFLYKQGEVDNDGITATLVNIDFESIVANTVHIVDPSGASTSSVATIVDDIATFKLIMTATGTYKFELVVTNANGITKSATFNYSVLPALAVFDDLSYEDFNSLYETVVRSLESWQQGYDTITEQLLFVTDNYQELVDTVTETKNQFIPVEASFSASVSRFDEMILSADDLQTYIDANRTEYESGLQLLFADFDSRYTTKLAELDTFKSDLAVDFALEATNRTTAFDAAQLDRNTLYSNFISSKEVAFEAFLVALEESVDIDVVTLSDRVDTATQNIVEIDGRTLALEFTTDSLSNEVITARKGRPSLNDRLSSIDTDIDQLEQTTIDHDSRLVASEYSLSDTINRVTSAETNINSVTTLSNQNKEKTDELTVRTGQVEVGLRNSMDTVVAIDTAQKTLSSQQTTLSSRVTVLEGNAQVTLEPRVRVLETANANTESVLGSVATDIAQLKSLTLGHTVDIGTLNNAISALDSREATRHDSTSATIATLQDAMQVLTDNVVDNDSDINGLQQYVMTKITSIEDRLAIIEAQLGGL